MPSLLIQKRQEQQVQAVLLTKKTSSNAFTELYALELVGPFIYLENEEEDKHPSKNKADYLVVSRFSTDLPEMQTLMVYRGGRFCYWRDVPEEEPGYLIHVPNEPKNFPQFTIVGDKSPFWALAFLMNKEDKKQSKHLGRHLLPKTLDLQKFDQKFIDGLRSQRKKTSLGEPFHGMGIYVEFNEEGVGYRPVTDDINDLKAKINQRGTEMDSGNNNSKSHNDMLEIYDHVLHEGFEESHFELGLELGHDLFVSNYECFDGMAKAMLARERGAYKHLKRDNFARILEKHWGHGRRVNDKDLKSYK